MQNRRTLSCVPQLPAVSGRILLWEQTRPWGRPFLNRLQVEASDATDLALVVEQAIFVHSPRELADAVENHPASFVIAESTTRHMRELLAQLPFLRQAKPLLRVAVACFDLPRKTVDEYEVTEAVFREAGAVAVLVTQRELLTMVPAVATHFSAIPRPKTDWRNDIEQRLPWRNVPTGR